MFDFQHSTLGIFSPLLPQQKIRGSLEAGFLLLLIYSVLGS